MGHSVRQWDKYDVEKQDRSARNAQRDANNILGALCRPELKEHAPATPTEDPTMDATTKDRVLAPSDPWVPKLEAVSEPSKAPAPPALQAAVLQAASTLASLAAIIGVAPIPTSLVKIREVVANLSA